MERHFAGCAEKEGLALAQGHARCKQRTQRSHKYVDYKTYTNLQTLYTALLVCVLNSSTTYVSIATGTWRAV